MYPPGEGPDKDVEKYLDDFELRRPCALPRYPARISRMRVLAVAASILAACGTSVWLVLQTAGTQNPATALSAPPSEAGQSQRVSAMELTHLALEDSARFEVEMSAASRATLPTFRRTDSALRVLAKE
jgi:hypothetical protein